MRIVADTNTLVSGFGWGGPPGHPARASRRPELEIIGGDQAAVPQAGLALLRHLSYRGDLTGCGRSLWREC